MKIWRRYGEAPKCWEWVGWWSRLSQGYGALLSHCWRGFSINQSVNYRKTAGSIRVVNEICFWMHGGWQIWVLILSKRSTIVPVYKGNGGRWRCLRECWKRGFCIRNVLIDDIQFGFMPWMRIAGAWFIMREVQERQQSKKKTRYYVFMVSRGRWWNGPYGSWCGWGGGCSSTQPRKCSPRLALSLEQILDQVKVNSKVKIDFHQRSVLDPLLFAVVMDVELQCGQKKDNIRVVVCWWLGFYWNTDGIM